MHVVMYLPDTFYSAIASTFVETLQAINEVRGDSVFSFEFVSKSGHARSKSGIVYPVKSRPSLKMDVLILLTGVGLNVVESVCALEAEFCTRETARAACEKAGGSHCFYMRSLLYLGEVGTLGWEECDDLLVAEQGGKEKIPSREMGTRAYCHSRWKPIHNRRCLRRAGTH